MNEPGGKRQKNGGVGELHCAGLLMLFQGETGEESWCPEMGIRGPGERRRGYIRYLWAPRVLQHTLRTQTLP